jgi:hypothetical protein
LLNDGSSAQRVAQFNQTINTSVNEMPEASQHNTTTQHAGTTSLQVSVSLEPRRKGASQHMRTHTEAIDSPAAPK